ncbi:MAG: PAS domain S-box protein [Thermodesulfobacteriota bacterium]
MCYAKISSPKVQVGIFLAALLSELISRPLDQLSRAAMEIGRGNFHHRVPEKGRDEIGRVAVAFNTMATELEASIHKEHNTRARLEAIVENSAVGITITDRHGNIMQSNPAFCRMLGYSGQELEGKHLSLFTHPDDVGKRSPVYQQLLEGGIDHVHFQKRYRHKNGRTVWGQLTLSLLRSEEGEPDLVIGMIEDISSRKLLEEERQKANKLESVGILAGGIAHDFNNLLTAVIGNIILARHRVQTDANTRELLEAAERASLRAKNLTDQLLTFSRGGAPVKKNVELRVLIEDTVRFHLSGSKTRAEFHFATGLHPVLADAGQISQVVQNIVKNSEQAMPAGGTITIAAENHVVTAAGLLPEGRYVKITITDQGSGIPEENLSRIFDPYFTTKEKGNGLGLAICYSIIKSHDGLITVDSTLGVGTSFAIYLPAAETPPALVAAEKENDRGATRFSGKILVMDDDRMVREVIGSMLTDLGFTVVLTADGREAVAAYKKALLDLSPVHLVIVDLTVPGGMGGRDTLAELRKIDPAVRVVVSSGYTDDPLLTNFADHGFAGVIGKPFAINELVPLLKTFFPSR